MGYRTWIYHKTEAAKIIDSDDRPGYEDEGWRKHQDEADKASPLTAAQRKARDKALADEAARVAEEKAEKAAEEAKKAVRAAEAAKKAAKKTGA
jgi:hypothetical protein